MTQDEERQETEEDEEDGDDSEASIQELNNGHSNGIHGDEEEEGEDDCLTPFRSTPSSPSSSLAFPVSRVRRLIKSENDIQMVGMEAIFVIAKAAEFFLEQFVEDSFDNMSEENRSTLAYKDLSSTVLSAERLEFLADFVPDKVPASRALAEAPFQIS